MLIRTSSEDAPFEFPLIATGSDAGDGVPLRVSANGEKKGTGLLRGVQRQVQAAQRVVVMGGGAAGVKLAADAKRAYPNGHSTLVQTREAVMH